MLSESFRMAVEAGEIAGASRLFREDAVFRSPVVYRPYVGRDTVLKVLEAAERVLGVGSGAGIGALGTATPPNAPKPGLPPTAARAGNVDAFAWRLTAG